MSTATRLDFRLDSTDKAHIKLAADLRGMSLSTFIRNAALQEADSVTAAKRVTLSADESRHFLAALDKPFQPHARLRKAMERGLARR